MTHFQPSGTCLSSHSSPLGPSSPVTFLSYMLLRLWDFMKVKVKLLCHVQLFATPWTVAYHTPRSMGFLRQDYWSRLPFPSPGNLPNPGIEPRSLTLYTDALPSKPPEKSKDTSDTLKCTVVHMSQKVNTT